MKRISSSGVVSGEVKHFAQVEFDALRLLFAAGGVGLTTEAFRRPVK